MKRVLTTLTLAVAVVALIIAAGGLTLHIISWVQGTRPTPDEQFIMALYVAAIVLTVVSLMSNKKTPQK